MRDKQTKHDQSSFIQYKEAVSRKHKNMAQEQKQWLQTVKLNAREELLKLDETKRKKEEDRLNLTRNMNREAMQTLEAVESKVKSGFDKGMEMRERTK